MKIQILGTGCPKCRTLESNAKEALAETDLDAEIVKVSDINEIMEFGVLMTPALAIDGDVKSSGKILTKNQIIDILNNYNN
ncbi:MAG: TM0996/MTH895 family glutaredoxin-like protein [Spirochaetales bacterium]|nr:TM0996/MTH895 family glutaredoxin-like protein [Spirochaetales bacterium]